jgi:DNA-binding LytR/AlgR family response regulator
MIYAPILWEFTIRWFADGEDHGVTRSMMFGFVLLISLFVGVLILLFSQKETKKIERSAPAIIARLPEAEPGQILFVCAQDHYVHVVTAKGRFPVLMRFADAIAELDGVEGVQVHRSHWVARTAVEGRVRRNGRHYVTLVDGSEIPISRSYLRSAESAGLL